MVAACITRDVAKDGAAGPTLYTHWVIAKDAKDVAIRPEELLKILENGRRPGREGLRHRVRGRHLGDLQGLPPTEANLASKSSFAG